LACAERTCLVQAEGRGAPHRAEVGGSAARWPYAHRIGVGFGQHADERQHQPHEIITWCDERGASARERGPSARRASVARHLLRVSPTPPRHLATSPPRQPDPNVRTSRGWMCAHFRGVGFISLSPHQKCAHFLPRGATYATRARAAAARCCVRTSFTSACFLSVGAE